MKQNRYFAACTVFEGKIFITGGTYNWYKLNSVETYDYYDNKWTYLPEMIERRSYHASVKMSNKMFVIGGGYTDGLGCEVFDSFSRKFTYISAARIKTIDQSNSEVVCISDKIIVFYETFYLESVVNTKVFVYDDCWTEKKIDF